MVAEAKVDRRWIVAPVIAGSSPVGYPGAMVLQGIRLRIVPDGGRRVRASRTVERRFLDAPLQRDVRRLLRGGSGRGRLGGRGLGGSGLRNRGSLGRGRGRGCLGHRGLGRGWSGLGGCGGSLHDGRGLGGRRSGLGGRRSGLGGSGGSLHRGNLGGNRSRNGGRRGGRGLDLHRSGGRGRSRGGGGRYYLDDWSSVGLRNRGRGGGAARHEGKRSKGQRVLEHVRSLPHGVVAVGGGV